MSIICKHDKTSKKMKNIKKSRGSQRYLHRIKRVMVIMYLFYMIYLIQFQSLFHKENQNQILIGFLLPILYGVLILWAKHRKRKWLLSSDIYQVDELSGTDFELFLYYHFKEMGYKVKLTPVTHDFGADLILKYRGQTTVVQAKRWNESVGIKAVQEIVGAISYYDADYSMVITNSVYTQSAKILANANDVVLIDRKGLIHMIEEGIIEEELEVNEYAESLKCPFCNSRLVIRNGSYGKFYGCSNYPKCRYTKDI